MPRWLSIGTMFVALSVGMPAQADQSLWYSMTGQCRRLDEICTRPTPVPTGTRTPLPSSTPTRTPSATQSPRPSSVPIPPIPTLPPEEPCQDGTLDRALLGSPTLYGLTKVRVPIGVRRRLCAPVGPPIVPAGLSPGRLIFSWEDLSGTGCGALNVQVEPLSGPARPRGTSGFVSTGNIQYVRKVDGKDDPKQTAPGLYTLTVSGGSETCVLYEIGWTWVP